MLLAGAAQVLLAVVLLVSGTAKARDLAGTSAAARDLGVPLAGLVAVALPPLELAAAAGLLLLPLPGVLLATALLGGFTAVVARALQQGTRPSCHCFGRLGGGEVSALTLLRNLLLLAAAVLALLLGPVRPGPAAVALGGALGVGVLAGPLLSRPGLRRADLQRTRPVPTLRPALLDGGEADLRTLPGRRPLVLVVLAPGCASCRALLPDVRRWAVEHADVLSLAVLGVASAGLVRDLVGDLPVPVLLDEGGPLRDALQVPGTPAAVLLTPDGRQAERVAHGPDEVRRLVALLV